MNDRTVNVSHYKRMYLESFSFFIHPKQIELIKFASAGRAKPEHILPQPGGARLPWPLGYTRLPRPIRYTRLPWPLWYTWLPRLLGYTRLPQPVRVRLQGGWFRNGIKVNMTICLTHWRPAKFCWRTPENTYTPIYYSKSRAYFHQHTNHKYRKPGDKRQLKFQDATAKLFKIDFFFVR
jgi:hypothetical protein